MDSPDKLEGGRGVLKLYLQNGCKIVVIDGLDIEAIFRCNGGQILWIKGTFKLHKLGAQKLKLGKKGFASDNYRHFTGAQVSPSTHGFLPFFAVSFIGTNQPRDI